MEDGSTAAAAAASNHDDDGDEDDAGLRIDGDVSAKRVRLLVAS